MQPNIKRLFLLLIIFLGMNVLVKAQSLPADTAGNNAYIRMVVARMGISQAQAMMMRQILQQTRSSVTQVMHNATLTAEQKQVQSKQLTVQGRARVMALLTPSQQQSYQLLLQSSEGARRAREKSQVALNEIRSHLAQPVQGATLQTVQAKP